MAPTPMPFDPLLERLRQATHGLYEIRDELGRGGMAVVYMAKDLRLHRPVAIKVMQPALLHAEGMTDRFLQEARIAAQLQHPNIIIVHDVQQQDDLLYFVMNLVEGATVDEMMRASPFSIAQVRWILSSAARGLAHAHSEGVVHRDVKPGNLLVNVKGDVIVTDFGIAKGVDSVRMTQTGMAIGTPVYMSPEQVTGTTGLSAASDQYSLGIAAYEMLTGAPPFTGESAFALQVAHVQREAVEVTTRRPDCPPDLAFIVHRMMSKAPEQRWSSLDEVSALASAALPFGGGEARQQLAATARMLHDRRGLSTAVYGVRTPRSPVPRSQAPKEPTSGSVTSLVLNPHESQLHISGKVRLHSLARVNGQDSGEHRARWMSTDPNVAVVTDEGEVMGIGAGRAEIIAVNQFGEARATIEVMNASEPSIALMDTPVPVAAVATPVPVPAVVSTPAPVAPRIDTPAPVIHIMSVDITPSRAMMEGGEVIPLTLKVRDMRGSIVADPVVEWHSDAPLVAWVDDRGTVAALASGRATISATVDGVTSRAIVEVGSTWKTVNSLEQLAVRRPFEEPVSPAHIETPVTPAFAVPVPVSSDATPTPAAVPVEPALIDALVARKSASSAAAPVVVNATAEKAVRVSAKPASASRSRVMIGGSVALVAIAATVWALMTPSTPTDADGGGIVRDSSQQVRSDSTALVVAARDSLATRDSLARDSATRVAAGDSQAKAKAARDSAAKIADARNLATKGKAARDSAARAAATRDSIAIAVAARDAEAKAKATRDSIARVAAARDGEARAKATRDSVARVAAARDSATKARTTRDSVARDSARKAEVKGDVSKPLVSTEASVAGAVRDLKTQLQRKEVVVGPLGSFFKLGTDHETVSVGQPHSISTANGTITATVAIEIKRTAPSGNIERRSSQVTFRVLGSGESAKAQAINASSLQKP